MSTHVDDQMKELFQGFSKLDRADRLHRLQQMGVLTKEDIQFLSAGSPIKIDLAEKFIENVIGYFQLPLGVAANFVINDKAYAIPMAVEETSIIAAASKTAKWIRQNGEITAETIGESIIGQIQLAHVNDWSRLEKVIAENRSSFIENANCEVAAGLVNRGGGVTDIQLRRVSRDDGTDMAVIHVHANVCDAMGANIMNQVCEFLKTPIEELSGETVNICILSNLSDTKLTRARVVVRGLEADLMNRIAEASLFAQKDPYRACTNNKGVLNGIDPILIATGNDWRAAEAGIHAHAARDGQYRSITTWTVLGDELIGEFEAPIMLGVVGGVTKLHPSAKMALRMLAVKDADELAQVCACVGLVQNLGALRALTTEGIIEGHMKLHIKNLSLGAGASENEMPMVQKRLEEILSLTKRISLNNAIEILKDIRGQASPRREL